jgi:hypothetical protein
MVKLKILHLFILGFCTNLVLTDTVGIKENIKDLDDDDVLVISVAHSKKDTKNSTIAKLVSLSTDRTTEAGVVDSNTSSTSTTPLSTITKTEHPVVKKEAKSV